jgi:hypothetical protein
MFCHPGGPVFTSLRFFEWLDLPGKRFGRVMKVLIALLAAFAVVAYMWPHAPLPLFALVMLAIVVGLAIFADVRDSSRSLVLGLLTASFILTEVTLISFLLSLMPSPLYVGLTLLVMLLLFVYVLLAALRPRYHSSSRRDI